MALRVEDIDLAADRVLVERWQAGEHEAFDDLYRRYFTRLRSYCQRRVGDHDTAEEIAQEAFVKALQALPRFAGERRFYPWVTVIASRLCVDHHRRLGRVRPVEEVDAGSVDGDHGARLAFLADVDNLDRALQRLGPRHLEVLELRERKGMSYAEIADHLAVPQSTVEALLFRARKALRREFMAVSGDGRLASIPLIGALVRRVTAARWRVADAMPSLSQLTGPMAAGVVAVALVAPFSAVSEKPPPPPVARTHIHVTTTSAVSPILPAPVVAPSPDLGGGRRGATTTTAPPLAPPGVERVPGAAARDDAANMPLYIDLGPTGLGVDPHQPLSWLPLPQLEENR